MTKNSLYQFEIFDHLVIRSFHFRYFTLSFLTINRTYQDQKKKKTLIFVKAIFILKFNKHLFKSQKFIDIKFLKFMKIKILMT